MQCHMIGRASFPKASKPQVIPAALRAPMATAIVKTPIRHLLSSVIR